MKKLHFDYHTQIRYTEAAEKCHYTLKCIPKNTMRQQLEDMAIQILPENSVSEGEDSFGNQTLFGSIYHSHEEFSFHVEGTIITGLAEWEAEEPAEVPLMYRYPYHLTRPGQGLLDYFESLKINRDARPRETGIMLMHQLYQDFCYEKNVTDIATTAEEAWQLGKGVCQDYAHILIVLCRLAGIPARYVSGMLTGEGYSHAWVEIYSEGGWYALDPANDVIVTDSHIRIGVGREASDCVINRGIITGGGEQIQSVRVCVEEIKEG